ncbi:hypothetical protein [Phaeobacter sp. C3_T13_0]
MTSIDDAEVWHLNFFGSDVEVLHPVPGVAEFKAEPNVWSQIFEADTSQS